MNRRMIFKGVAGLCSVGFIDSAFSETKARAASASTAADCGEFKMDPVAQALKDDLDALGARQYSEEGVAVFLFCEDVIGAKTGKPKAPPNELSAGIVAGLRDNGRAWKHLFPAGPAGDVNRLVEVLAVRDFNRDRLEKKS